MFDIMWTHMTDTICSFCVCLNLFVSCFIVRSNPHWKCETYLSSELHSNKTDFEIKWWSLKRPFFWLRWGHFLLGWSVLGDSFGSLRDGMFGQLSWKQKPDGGLDFPGGDGWPLVVVSKTWSLWSDTLKDIVGEGVHDAHCLGGDTGVWVDLF